MTIAFQDEIHKRLPLWKNTGTRICTALFGVVDFQRVDFVFLQVLYHLVNYVDYHLGLKKKLKPSKV